MKSKKLLPPVEYLNGLFIFDGVKLLWNFPTWETGRWHKLFSGKAAGTKNSDGYIRIAYKNKRWMAHRIIYKMAYNIDDTAKEIDHINGNTEDNRLENLRLVEPMVNCWNNGGKKGALPTGVSFNDNGYNATIFRAGVRYYIGRFRTALDASNAYLQKKQELDAEHYVLRSEVSKADNKHESIRGNYKKDS